jgi:hypothetical protein
MGMMPSGLKNEISLRFNELSNEVGVPITIYTAPEKEGCPNCFTGDILIDTPSGVVPIKYISIGDTVYDGYGVKRKVVHKFERAVEDQNFTRVRAWGYPIGISATSDHKLKVCRNYGTAYNHILGDKIEDVEIGRLDTSYCLVKNIVPLPEEELSHLSVEWYTSKYGAIKKDLPQAIKIDSNFLLSIGLYLAEGVTSKNRQVFYCLNDEEEDVGYKVCSYWSDLLDCSFNLEFRGDSRNRVFNLYSSHLARFLDNFCGHGAGNKYIPDELYYKLNRSQTLDLLEGLFFGDGSYDHENGVYILGTIAEKMALQVYNLLWSCGCYASIRKQYIGERSDGITRQPVYFVYWYTEKMRVVSVYDNTVYMPIKEVSHYTESTKVYNLEIDKEHSYLARGISVNNCHQDSTGASVNKFNTSFVTPVVIFGVTYSPQSFTRGRCPVCYGEGHLEYESTTIIHAITHWNPQSVMSHGEMEATPAGLEGKNAVRVKAAKCYYNIMRDSEKAVIDGIECVLHLPPVLRSVGTKDVMAIAYYVATEVGSSVRDG